MKYFTLLSSILALGLTGVAAAGPQLSAQSIIVNPIPTALDVQVWTDRDTSGTRNPSYNVGDDVRIYAKVNRDAYVYLFNVDPSGSVDMILPNDYQYGANYVRGGDTVVFPNAYDNFTYTIDNKGGYGTNKVLAVASEQPLGYAQMRQFQRQGMNLYNLSGSDDLARALSIVVSPIQQTSWTSDVAFYNVAGPSYVQPAPVYRESAYREPAYREPVYVSPAPAPISTAFVTPAPVTPAPVYQPLHVPRPVYSIPNWHITFSLGGGLLEVHNSYVTYLENDGYRLVNSRQNGNRVYSTFTPVSGGNDITLLLEKNGTSFDVKLSR